ncbi:MAG: hypothetical protein HC903_20990 [Methylacidiphilales bacterium]|nr:hypothetical protein [Candidatus Methylacidiphilales bacterium]NJR17915.1 hypothetical protein [Calothrix sp. CSU_2_0]
MASCSYQFVLVQAVVTTKQKIKVVAIAIFVHEIKFLSIRRSGISQIAATKTYSRQATYDFTKASGIAIA